MPRRSVWLPILIALWAPAAAWAQAPPDATPANQKYQATVDSTTRAITGYWRSEASPGALYLVTPWSRSAVFIEALSSGAKPGFGVVGFFDGKGLTGVMRDSSVDSYGLGDKVKVIRLALLAPDRAAVEFADDLRGKATSRETWQRVGRPGVSAREPGAPDSAAPGLPRIGEYVYVETLPEAIERVAPDYPEWARKKGIAGAVVVQALVSKEGRVVETRVTVSIPELDDYAVAAVKQWRFKPASAKGQPVAVWVAIPVRFTLH